MKKIITLFITAAFALPVMAQSFSGFEAESGTAGSEWATATAEGNTIIYTTTNGGGSNPGSANRVISYTVTFPQAGTYNLYARMRVGANTFSDDSYFLGNGFGAKDPLNNGDWILANGLASAGYTLPNDIVSGSGSAGSNIFKWVNMSVFAGKTYVVTEGNLTQTFVIGAREDGLDFDKFVFGLTDYTYTVDNLNKGEEGSNTPPPPPYTPPGPPIATGKSKWLGGVYSNPQKPNFDKYWNQVTPENAGKWGSVEGTRDVMNWVELDSAYKLAKDHGFPFKMHTLIWGGQQPAWLSGLTAPEQLEEINEWFAAVAERYPAIDIIEVVNEPIHQQPVYKGALGGDGATGWDWVLESFRLARQYFPNSKLWINDYSIINSVSTTATYLNIINLLKAESLIDGIGEQGHAFTTFGTSANTMLNNLNTLAGSGLPLYITELDIDGAPVGTPAGDTIQLNEYKRVFPLFWEHPAIQGITVWGYLPGHWRSAQGAYMAYENGAERPALKWLREYVNNTKPVLDSGQVFSVAEDAANGTPVGQVGVTDPDAGQVFAKPSWKIIDGSGKDRFAIDATTGALSLTNNAGFDFESDTTSYNLTVQYNDGFASQYDEPAAPPSGNLVSNGDFESGGGWTGWGNNSVRGITADGQGHTGKAQFVTNPSITPNYWDVQTLYELAAPAANGATYNLSFWVKGTATGTIRPELQSPDYSANGFGMVSVTTEWQHVQLSTAITAADRSRFIISYGEFAGTVYIDDVVLENAAGSSDTTVPAPLPPGVQTITVNITNVNDNTPVIAAGTSFNIDGGVCNEIGKVMATDADDTNEPGFTTFQDWQIVGGQRSGYFEIDPATGTIRLAPTQSARSLLNSPQAFPLQATLLVSVSDGLHTSATETVTITVPDKVTVCHNGTTMLVSRSAAKTLLMQGDCLGSCSTAIAGNGTDAVQAASVAVSNAVVIYPNPAKDKININLGNNTNSIKKVQLIDISGRVIKNISLSAEKASGVLSIPANNLQAGTYIVRLTGNTIQNHKVVIQR